jgi:glycosyltransferase involved in cell wall biosynthesis
MMPEATSTDREAYVSLAIFAWNEERTIEPMLDTLFRQTLFEELNRRGLCCEIICMVNGCTDRTPEVAAEFLARQIQTHPCRDAFSCRVVNLKERGKLNAWNQFVHYEASGEARFLFLMDADILIHERETLRHMLAALERDAEARVAVDCPRKDISFRGSRGVRNRMSLAASELTGSGEAQLCAQLYGIRTETARNIYMPRDLFACEDGFIKALVCTDFLEHPVWPRRIRLAEGAEHTFEAYTSPRAVLKNQKRQIIGQTILHVLLDQYLITLPASQRRHLAETLRQKDKLDPPWLKRLIQEHLQRTRFPWRLFPNLLRHRFERWARMRGLRRITCLPAAMAGAAAGLIASFMAYRSLKQGGTHYWPQAKRAGLKQLQPVSTPGLQLGAPLHNQK